jgi:hypothetical protein
VYHRLEITQKKKIENEDRFGLGQFCFCIPQLKCVTLFFARRELCSNPDAEDSRAHNKLANRSHAIRKRGGTEPSIFKTIPFFKLEECLYINLDAGVLFVLLFG